MKKVVIDLGEFVKLATDAQNSGNVVKLTHQVYGKNLDGSFGSIPIKYKMIGIRLKGVGYLFRPDDLDWLMHHIIHVFYKCYGGWKMALCFTDGHMFNGNVSYIPYDCVGSSALEAVE